MKLFRPKKKKKKTTAIMHVGISGSLPSTIASLRHQARVAPECSQVCTHSYPPNENNCLKMQKIMPPKFMGEGEGDEFKDRGTCCAGENSLVWDHWARNNPSTTGSVCMRKVLNCMIKVLQHWTWQWFLRYGTQSISKRENRKLYFMKML